MSQILIALSFLVATSLFAETADVKVKDIKADGDTSIIIKKGKANDCIDYEVVEGMDEVFGTPQFDKAKAYQGWDAACKEWKASMRDLNKENKILTLSCHQPTVTKEGDQFAYKSAATYKLRVRIRDKS